MHANYERLTTIPLETGLALSLSGARAVRIAGAVTTVNSSESFRMRTFVRSHVCVECGLTATHFAVERCLPIQSPRCPYHLNLYGLHARTGAEIMLTHDHIIARALGGADAPYNIQTMCWPCNMRKGHFEGRINELLTLCGRLDNPVVLVNFRLASDIKKARAAR